MIDIVCTAQSFIVIDGLRRIYRRTDVPSSQGFATLAQGCKRSTVTHNKEFEVFLVPNRSFGRKKLIQRYGHAASNDR